MARIAIMKFGIGQQGERGAGDQAVGRAARSISSEHPERDGDQQCQHDRHQAELQGHRRPLQDGLGDLLPRLIGGAEVTGDHAAEPGHVTHRQRIVQAEVGPDGRNRLRCGLIAEDLPGRVARQQAGEQEGQERDGQYGEYQPLDLPSGVPHRVTPSSVAGG
jgi:hypothetical protein